MLSEEALAWREGVKTFIDAARVGAPPLPDGHMLDPLGFWQRRITGGTLQSFLEFAVSVDAVELFPELHDNGIEHRIFVFVTDLSGEVAYRELIRGDSNRALCVRREEWVGFLGDEAHDRDDEFTKHYECWSAWHQDVDPVWEVPEGDWGQLWVHEEGFALADGAGRGSQHVWSWDGEEMTLVVQDVTIWTQYSGTHPGDTDE